MPLHRKITMVETEKEKFFKLQSLLDSGILGPVTVSFAGGGIIYILTDSQEIALKSTAGIYFVAVWVRSRIRKAKKQKENEE